MSTIYGQDLGKKQLRIFRVQLVELVAEPGGQPDVTAEREYILRPLPLPRQDGGDRKPPNCWIITSLGMSRPLMDVELDRMLGPTVRRYDFDRLSAPRKIRKIMGERYTQATIRLPQVAEKADVSPPGSSADLLNQIEDLVQLIFRKGARDSANCMLLTTVAIDHDR